MAETQLTERHRQILDFIEEQLQTRGYPPSVREIGEAVGLTSTSTVHAHLATLQRLGYLRRDPTKPRAIEVRYDPGSKAMADLWVVAVKNPGFFDFKGPQAKNPDGSLRPRHGFHTLPDGTLTPLHVVMALTVARDGTVYATTIYPFTLLRIPAVP